jgi:Holliday junction DNA helicase RuvB
MTTRDDEGARPVIDLVAGLAPKEIDRELRLADRQTDAGNRRLAFYLADMETRGVCQILGYPTATAYAVKRLEMGRRHAQQLIAIGRALEELPKVDAAFCEGLLNWSRVRLLVKIAVPETEAAWLERALECSWTDFEREVLTSEKGRPPRQGRKGLPRVKIGVTGKLDRLAWEKWELAKRKLSDELGEIVGDAELMRAAASLILGTKRDGSVPGRERLDDSLYRVVVERCPDCRESLLQTEGGAAEIAPAQAAVITCDARVEPMSDHPGEGSPPTPEWMRKRVLARDRYSCVVCGGRRDVQAHHVIWRSGAGPTKLANLATLCSRCHGLVHENLVFMSGTAPGDLRITDAEGESLRRDPKAVGVQLRMLRREMKIEEHSVKTGAPLPEVTFAGLPPSVGPDWLDRHAHLLTWNDVRGEFVFEPGSPIAPQGQATSDRRPALDADGAPISLAGLIGQRRLIFALQAAIDAARIRQKPLDHVLLLGQAGLGKTTLARAVANSLGARAEVTSGPLIKDASVLIRLLGGLGPGTVLFIDEIHGLPRPVAESLYEAMEDGVLRLPVTDGHRSKTIEVRLNPFTLIGATTELGKVPAPFQSRFGIQEHLDAFSTEEIAKIGVRTIVRTPLEIDPEAALGIARVAHGIPRHAVKLSKRIADLALTKRRNRIDAGFVEEALRAYGIDERGLDHVAQAALRVLERHGRGRPMGLTRWSAASGLCPAVLRATEVVLLRLGLIAVTPRGRMAA